MGLRRILLIAAALMAAAFSTAEKYALLIGIEVYEDSDRITSLNAANADARDLGKALTEVGGFKKENVRVLTSDQDPKPSRRNIMFEVGQLIGKCKAEDTVFILFSGHGIMLEDGSYLVPWDGDLRNDTALKTSAISAHDFRVELLKIKSKGLILAFDMCRNLPYKSGGKSAEDRNSLGQRQAKDLVVVAPEDGSGPNSIVTLFSCSPLQRSWEWRDKKRGFFSYFLEKGLRGDAADQNGVVDISGLVKYLSNTVPPTVAREVNEEQVPYPQTSGPNALSLVLVQGAPKKPPEKVNLPPPPEPTGDPKKDEHNSAFQRGVLLLQQGRYDAAVERFQEALAADPKSISANLYLGLALQRGGYLIDAEKFYLRTTQLDPKNGKSWTNLGALYIDLKRWDDAETALRKAIAIDDKLPAAQNNLGKLLWMVRNDRRGAEECFKKAAKLDPNDQAIQNNLGVICRANGDFDGAEAAFTKAIKFDPSFFDPVYNLAMLQDQIRKQYDKADALYLQSMKLAPNDARPYNQRGMMIVNRGSSYADAEQMFRKSCELNQTDGQARANWSLALFRINRKEEAMTQARKAIDLGYRDPNHPAFKALGIRP